ncbi:MAG TPA: HlyD family efflux transporter periplasmic adaptor subunit [Anaerolineae bacterium]|nr:HlyD family efflux transporter periplasmic adaptor subunit [Anaerolineae bacterium]
MKKWIVVCLGLLALGLVGCGSSVAAESAPATAPVVVDADAGTIIVEAALEPAQWQTVSFASGGEVSVVQVEPGDSVAEGDVLAQLDTTLLELALVEAQANVAFQQSVLAELTATQPTTATASLALEQARVQSAAPDIAAARAQLAQAEITLNNAQDEYNKSLGRSWEEEWVRNQYAEVLRRAELDYQAVQAQLNKAYQAQSAHSFDVERQEQEAALGYTQALTHWEQQQLQAQTRLEQAQVAVTRIQTQLADATLYAPFAGVISDVPVKAGDTVAPGQPVITLATLAQLRARTKDLTELDVVRITEGQAATVTVEALPDVNLSGKVARIELQAEDYRGDVVYPVIIELDEVPAELLRWGMTALVEFEAP